MRPLLFLAERLYHRLLKYRAGPLPVEIEAALQKIASQGGRNDAFQRCRVADISKLLNEAKPSKICELGSGLSTVVLSAYPAELQSFEESAEWAAVTRSALSRDCVHLTPVEIRNGCAGYSLAIPQGTDFVYVDGPTRKIGGAKLPNANILEFLDSERPKMIVVDGRIETVNAIMQKTTDYSVSRSSQYALKVSRLRHFLPFSIHTVFRLRTS